MVTAGKGKAGRRGRDERGLGWGGGGGDEAKSKSGSLSDRMNRRKKGGQSLSGKAICLDLDLDRWGLGLSYGRRSVQSHQGQRPPHPA